MVSFARLGVLAWCLGLELCADSIRPLGNFTDQTTFAVSDEDLHSPVMFDPVVSYRGYYVRGRLVWQV